MLRAGGQSTACQPGVSPDVRGNPSVPHQRLQGTLEAAVARGYDGEGEAEPRGGIVGEGTQLGGLVLGQPDDARVVAEVLLAQLGPPVQAELGLDGARERL